MTSGLEILLLKNTVILKLYELKALLNRYQTEIYYLTILISFKFNYILYKNPQIF